MTTESKFPSQVSHALREPISPPSHPIRAAATNLWLPPTSTNTRSRYVITTLPGGAFGFELRAHNGLCLLTHDEGMATSLRAREVVELVRDLVSLSNGRWQEAMCDPAQAPPVLTRQSLTGKWYFVIVDGERVLASSRPFDYRSRMDKALYAVRACAPTSRVVSAESLSC